LKNGIKNKKGKKMNYKFQIGDKIVEFSQEQLHSWARCMSIPTSEITLRDIADFCAWTAFEKISYLPTISNLRTHRPRMDIKYHNSNGRIA
jgi:hypothetical protein